MSCAEIKPKLELLADDELNSEQAATVLAHLDACSVCNEQWYAILHLRQAIKDRAATFTPGVDFEARLISALRAEAQASAGTADKAIPHAPAGALITPLAAVKRPLSWKIAAAILVAGAALTTLVRQAQNNQIVTSSSLGSAVKSTPVQKKTASQDGPVAAASLDDAMKNFDDYLQARSSTSASAASSAEIASLSERAGFKIKTMALEGFKLSSAQIVSTASGKAQLVRLCYSRAKGKKSGANGQNDSIICYQAAGGKLVANGLNEHLIDGRKICCGEKQDKSIVFIPGPQPKATTNSPEILLLSNISKSDLMDLVLSSS
jgi:hypothetical protein